MLVIDCDRDKFALTFFARRCILALEAVLIVIFTWDACLFSGIVERVETFDASIVLVEVELVVANIALRRIGTLLTVVDTFFADAVVCKVAFRAWNTIPVIFSIGKLA